MITPASFSFGRTVLRRCGVAPRQYLLLVTLFGMLGDRKELFGNLGMDKQAMQLTTLGLALPAGVFALFAFGPQSLAAYNLTVLTLSSFALLMVLLIEASNSFFNPAEVTVLAHRPISGATYFAAKFTYIAVVVIRVEAVLNGPAAFAALMKPEARWFYPLTHMASAWALGMFIALGTCALFGVLFRFVPTSRIRSVALWAQLAITTVPLFINLLMPRIRSAVAVVAPGMAVLDWSFVPLMWFNALALLGQADSPFVFGWPAAIGMCASTVFIGYGVRALSAGYMTRIVGVMRSGSRRARRRFRPSVGSRIVRALAGRPSAAAAWGFMFRMMRRDWQFRRAVLPLGAMSLFVLPAILRTAIEKSPFNGAPVAVGLLPELLPFGVFLMVAVLAYSDHFRGAWVFATASRDGRRGFVRGVYWSLWLPFLAAPFAVMAVVFSWYWGIIDATLFAAYGLSVASSLLAVQMFFVEGLPFARPPRPERAHMMLPFVLLGPIVLGIAWFVQGRFIFNSRVITLVASVVFAAVAIAIARSTLAVLDAKVGAELER